MKKNFLKVIYILFNVAFFAGLAAFCAYNSDKTAEFYCFLMQNTFTTKLIYLTIAFCTASYISGAFISLFFKSKSDELCNAYQKRHENISAQKDNDSAKISALEAKIATLETALQTALRNKE